MPCECNEYVGELLRGVRQHLGTFIKGLEDRDMARAQVRGCFQLVLCCCFQLAVCALLFVVALAVCRRGLHGAGEPPRLLQRSPASQPPGPAVTRRHLTLPRIHPMPPPLPQLGLAHSYSRAKVKFNVNKADNMIIPVC